MIWTDYFIKRKVQGLARDMAARTHCFRSLKEAHDIVVFFEHKDREAIEPCMETLRMLRKNVRSCVYISSHDAEFTPKGKNDYRVCSDGKEISRWGFPSADVTEQVNAMKADILIDLTGKSCYVMKYLMLLHPSTFKMGLKRGEQDLYDFSLSVTDKDDIRYLFGQIIFYLQTIRSK